MLLAMVSTVRGAGTISVELLPSAGGGGRQADSEADVALARRGSATPAVVPLSAGT